MDTETITAAFLHDVLMTQTSARRAGTGIRGEYRAFLDGITKLSRLQFDPGGAAGRKPAQDAAGDGTGYTGHHHQARRPASQYAHAPVPLLGSSACRRAGDAGHICASCQQAWNIRDKMGTGGSGIPVYRPQDVQRAGRQGGDEAQGREQVIEAIIGTLRERHQHKIEATIVGRPKHFYRYTRK